MGYFFQRRAPESEKAIVEDRSGDTCQVELGFAESRAAAVKHAVITTENTIGPTKKYLQLKMVTIPKQMASAQTAPRMLANVALGSLPNCHAKIAANTRNTEIRNPKPT